MYKSAYIPKRPVSLEDLQQVAVLSAPSISPDGSYLVYMCTRIVWEENIYKDFVVVIELSTGNEIQVWEGTSPRWSPVANEVAYTVDSNGKNCLWIYSLVTGAKRHLATIYESHYFLGHLANKNFAWSPNGLQLAFISTGLVNPPENVSGDVKVIDRLLYKTKGGRGRSSLADDQFSHIWVVSVHGGGSQLVTDGEYNEHSICWSPDSTKIAFVSNRSEDPDNNQLHDLWSVDVVSGITTRLTENIGTVYQPACSPDGKAIAFLATIGKVATNDSPAEDTQLYLLTLGNNVVHCLTQSFDRRIEQISWHPKANKLFFTAGSEGTTAIYRVAINSEHVEHIEGEDCKVLDYAINSAGDEICFVSVESNRPTEIFIHNLNSRTSRQITGINDLLLTRFSAQPAEPFWFSSFDEKDIQGWVIKPAQFNPQVKYPLVLVIHGGPHNMFGNEFEDRMQFLSASGYGVLFINPRGSSGYGQAFSNGTLLNWGGGDYKDLMTGVDVALQRNSWIDASCLGVTGQSYGGYMTNWIITQTNRFKAAVVDGGISNLVSFAGTSLYHSLIESEFNGSAYDNFPLLWQWSPLRNVKNVSTPTLIVHGELDNEVPLSQAEEMYIALKKQGVDSRFVQYLGEGHGWRPDLKPANRRDLLTRTVEWFDKYLAG
jgi:dipeptidyl aminopeptidase/acylaminoacyl peptidase